MAIDLEDIRKLPPKAKALMLCLACMLLGYFYYLYFFQATWDKSASLDARLTELEQQVTEKEKAVAQIDRYIREVNALKETFDTALLKLPHRREIPSLLASVALSGREAGVEFLLFEPIAPEKKAPEAKPATPPKPPVPEKCYEEIPVRVQFTGGFHNTLSFFEKIGRFPRIVHVAEIEMGESADLQERGRVVKTSCIVKTYMFVDRKP
jgi:type IV pilus assembly protein PilO